MHRNSIVCLLLSLALILSLAACGGGSPAAPAASSAPAANASSAAAPQSAPAQSESAPPSEAPAASAPAAPAEPMIPGKLYPIALEDRDPSVLRGLRIAGNQLGSADGFNGREPSLDDIRCIFLLNEWVEFYPDTDAKSGLRVWILRHRDDRAYYNDCKFSDLMPNFANYCDLHYPEDAEDPENYPWGSFYLQPDENEPGEYDFVFTYEGKAIAVMLARFYPEGELTDKSDEELEALMSEGKPVGGSSAAAPAAENGDAPAEAPAAESGDAATASAEGIFDAFNDAIGAEADTWPTPEMWESIGLPALDYSGSGESVSIFNYGDNLSVAGWADNETLGETIGALAGMLGDAGLPVEERSTLSGATEYVADYEHNGVPLQVRIGSNSTAQVNVSVAVSQ